MQTVIIGGGFIASAIHDKWMKGVEQEDMILVQDAYDFHELIQPYMQVDRDFEDLYNERRRK